MHGLGCTSIAMPLNVCCVSCVIELRSWKLKTSRLVNMLIQEEQGIKGHFNEAPELTCEAHDCHGTGCVCVSVRRVLTGAVCDVSGFGPAAAPMVSPVVTRICSEESFVETYVRQVMNRKVGVKRRGAQYVKQYVSLVTW